MKHNCLYYFAYLATVLLLWYGIMEMMLLLPMNIKAVMVIYALMFLYTPIAVQNFFTWIRQDLWQGSEQ
jgi:hypothetical protein